MSLEHLIVLENQEMLKYNQTKNLQSKEQDGQLKQLPMAKFRAIWETR